MRKAMVFVRRATDGGAARVYRPAPDRNQRLHRGQGMNKGKNGNKEVKKPKKVFVPNPPGLPASLLPSTPNGLKPKKR
jgi:hypothetical protein